MNIQEIIDRTKGIIVNPEAEWQKIDSEISTSKDVFFNYVFPYLLLNFVAAVAGSFIFPRLWFSPSYIIATAVSSFLVYVIVLFVTPYIIKALGNSFGSEVDLNKAFKLIAYSFTPSYVIGILTGLIPVLGVLGILGLYGLYIMWFGFGVLFKTPEDKKVGFYIVTLLIIIGEFFILSFILGAIVASLFLSSLYYWG